MWYAAKILFAVMAATCLSSCAPVSRNMGLVLSGGGAKGAYEIGVWKALCDTGIDRRIKVYSGSSVGAINATLFASIGDPDRCAKVWRESVGQVFVANNKAFQDSVQNTIDDWDSLMGDIRKGKEPGESLSAAEKVGAVVVLTMSMVVRASEKVNVALQGPSNSVGVCDSGRLREVLERSLPEYWRPDPPIVYVNALEKDSGVVKFFQLNGNKRDCIIDYLMASSAIPGVFDSVEIDGVLYVDGGFEQRGGDNIPIKPIRDKHPDVKDVFVVYLKSAENLKRRITPDEFKGGRLIEIIPSCDIGGALGGWQGTFDLSDEKVEFLIKLGYEDTMRVLEEKGFNRLKD